MAFCSESVFSISLFTEISCTIWAWPIWPSSRGWLGTRPTVTWRCAWWRARRRRTARTTFASSSRRTRTRCLCARLTRSSRCAATTGCTPAITRYWRRRVARRCARTTRGTTAPSFTWTGSFTRARWPISRGWTRSSTGSHSKPSSTTPRA